MKQKHYQIPQLDSDILAISPIELDKNRLYILTQQGYLYRYQITQQQLHKVCEDAITLPILNTRETSYRAPFYEMKCTNNGQFIAIYVNYGQFGIIIDTQTQQIVLAIDTQNYHEDTVPFSLAFSTFEHDEIVIYRSDWNRLETFNLSQNISTTERYIAPYERENRPEHYLDYFHGALYVSPNHHYILDDGWVWHPYGYPQVWSLQHWLSHNPFESEDGQSLQSFLFDEENWDDPMCWLDNNTFALWQTTLRAEENGGEGHESVACLHLRICQVLQNPNLKNPNLKNQNLKNEIWRFPEQTQKLFHIYVDDGTFIFVGNENISLYDIASQTLIAHIPNHLPNKQHLKRHSLWAFEHQQLIEITYQDEAVNKISV